MESVTSDETYICKLQVQDRHVYVKLIWQQNENNLFHIQVLDGENSWSGRFSNDFAKQFRERDNIDETEELYACNVKKSLSGEDDNYSYDFIIAPDDNDTATLSWKKRFRGDTTLGKGINVLHGKVPVHRDKTLAPKDSMIDILLNKNRDLKKEIVNHTAKNENLISELEKCKNELEKYVNIKTSLESTLYGKFVQLLNAKKRRIQLLEDNLLNFEEPNNITMGSELD